MLYCYFRLFIPRGKDWMIRKITNVNTKVCLFCLLLWQSWYSWWQHLVIWDWTKLLTSINFHHHSTALLKKIRLTCLSWCQLGGFYRVFCVLGYQYVGSMIIIESETDSIQLGQNVFISMVWKWDELAISRWVEWCLTALLHWVI